MNDQHVKRKKFYLLMGLYLLLVILDGLLTYLHTPDLALEGNPLVANLGLGWMALFIANVTVIALVGASSYYTFFKYQTTVAKADNRREYLSQLFFGRPDKFLWTLYKFPQNRRFSWAMFGYGIIHGLIVSRAILVLEWAFHLPPAYNHLRNMMPLGRLDIVLAMMVLVFSTWHWLNNEYLASKRMMQEAMDMR